MSADPRQHHVSSVQRRVVRGSLVLLAVALLAGIPLLVNGGFRLELAWKLGIAPGPGVERVAEGDSGQILIVVPIHATVAGGREEVRYQATFLATPSAGGYRFENLATGDELDVPVPRMDHIAASDDGTLLLIVSGNAANATRFLVDVTANSVAPLPAGQEAPSQPGEWGRSIWETRIGRSCSGISPQQTYIFCFKDPGFARFLAGDWQIDILQYGQFQNKREIYRGEGTQPVAGFTANEQWLYFQNEQGIWREAVSREMFAT